MQMEFLQSEQNAPRRRWILVLVDSTDGVTGKTGQTGTVEISKNGGSPVASTNSIVEVDSTNMPGHYYIELTTGELDTLGMISIYYKASGTLAFHDRGYVTYNDPFSRSGGALFVGDPGAEKGIRKDQADALLSSIRKIVKEELDNQEKLEIPEDDDSEQIGKLDQIIEILSEEEEDEDYSPILDAIAKIPTPKDYSKDLKTVTDQIISLGKINKIDISDFQKTVKDFQSKMNTAINDVEISAAGVKELSNNFAELQNTIEQYKATLKEQSDMDKRFDAMMSATNDKKLAQLISDIQEQYKKLVTLIVYSKFDIIKLFPPKK